MNFFSSNLKFLREKKGLKQSEIPDFKRSQWANYESGTSFPKFFDLISIANFFDITETELIHTDLSNVASENNIINDNKELYKETIQALKNTIKDKEEIITLLRKQVNSLKKGDFEMPPLPLVAKGDEKYPKRPITTEKGTKKMGKHIKRN